MITAIKVILTIGILLILSYPFIPLPGKLKKLSFASSVKYHTPHNRKNVFFLILIAVEFIVFAIIFSLFNKLSAFIGGIPFVGKLITNAVNSLNSQVDFIIFAIKLVIVNLLALYAFVFLKILLKKLVVDPLFKLTKKHLDKKKDQEAAEVTEEETPSEEDSKKKRKNNRIAMFLHTLEDDDDEEETDEEKPEGTEGDGEDKNEPEEKLYGPVSSFFLGLFFEGDQFQYARSWVVRTRMVLQCFIVLVEILYLFFIGVVLLSVFFPLPKMLYDMLINVFKIGDWYLYPVFSVIFLQELCNIFNTAKPEEEEEEKKEEEKKVVADNKLEARLRKVLSELKKRFDGEHSLRYYPEAKRDKVTKYKPTSSTYASALEYIRKQMDSYAGHTVESYMECIDAMFNDEHVYFAASFYSELGEYLVAYTYIRLLSGERLIFVVEDPEERITLRRFICERLMRLTGSSAAHNWRVYTSDERLDQADILIASPQDFRDGAMVSRYPAFFEEVSDAIFVDADRVISFDSYLCSLISNSLIKATEGRIRFAFLTLDYYQGFAASSLPKFFGVEHVLSFSSAKENESVSYVLWNKESKSHRIYSKYGQKLTSLEFIIANLAFKYNVDGVRVITESPLDHAEKKILASHNVEINKFHRDVADVNYMVYSDHRCNLSASIYACTRFRGKKKSIVHILSKPYLLREYYISKMATEDFINRSSFIQPRVTEHIERHKLSLMRVFCSFDLDGGILVKDFEKKMREVITFSLERGDIISSVFCKRLVASKPVNELKLGELAAYLVAGLCDTDIYYSEQEENRCFAESIGHRAKDFYLVIDPAKVDSYTLTKEKTIVFNRMHEILDRLLHCNDRVELRLNDKTIGVLDSFPSRVHLEYIVGQSILYNNAEYEIEHISADGRVICLRHENVKLRNCLDTVHLRRYSVDSVVPFEKVGILHNTKLMLEEIRVTKCQAKFIGETYGFYGLTSDKQTLDFYHKDGIDGNPHVPHPHTRQIGDGRILKVEFETRMECTDGMRLLLAAAFNEFAKTIFPKSYHCISFCPVLAEPLPFDETVEPETEIEHIKALYPYLKHPGEEFIETDPNRITFFVINDCFEDVGVFDWLYDPSGRYMQEFLANIYSYLHWLKIRPKLEHYIYFGGDQLPECYDLEGCCKLLEGYNLLLSDLGEHDVETAGDDIEDEKPKRCAFCHKVMESGRYSLFDNNRYICADCFETVDDPDKLDEMLTEMREYLKKTYPEISIGVLKSAFDPVGDLKEEQSLSEYYYRLDTTERTVFVERDDPITNVRVSLLRGLIGMWQSDNQLMIDYAAAQLYYEELLYLRSIGKDESADWILEALDVTIKSKLDEIAEYIACTDLDEKKDSGDESADETPESDENTEEDTNETPEDNDEEKSEDKKDTVNDADRPRRTSFSFLRMKYEELGGGQSDDGEDETDEDYSDGLYDPNKVPRFWKRYLRNQKAEDGREEELPEDEDGDEEEDDVGDGEFSNDLMTDNVNAPNETDFDDLLDDSVDEISDEDNTVTDDVVDGDQTPEEDDKNTKKKKDKKKFSLRDLFKKKKKDDTVVDEEPVVDDDQVVDDDNKVVEDDKDTDNDVVDGDPTLDDDQTSDEDDDSAKKKSQKKDKKKKSSKKLSSLLKKKGTPGERIVPYEEDEKTNPKIRVYNDLVRAAYNYSEEPISRKGITDSELEQVFIYIKGDYPELFWLNSYMYTSETVRHNFRCKNANGVLDVKQINKKRAELRKGAKTFTRGITKKTDPYKALLTIYRRLILTLDYDGIGLDAGLDRDTKQDDKLRSLHSALVEHKVVCAGYAAALQYLLQSVGIVCGYTISRVSNDGGSCHAFNILKIGKYCYYIDATWGDSSNTKSGDRMKDMVWYDYCCTPFEEFIRTPEGQEPLHYPRESLYPTLEKFHNTNHEYFRYHNAYLQSYKEEEIVRILAESALRYNAGEMGDFVVGIRFSTKAQAKYAMETLCKNGNASRLVALARNQLGKKGKNAQKLLERGYGFYVTDAGVLYIAFESPKKNDKRSKK